MGAEQNIHARKLKAILANLGWSHSILAAKTGYQPQTIRKIAAGISRSRRARHKIEAVVGAQIWPEQPVPSTAEREHARCLYLDRLCSLIEASRSAGTTVRQAIMKAHRHRRHMLFARGRLSRGRLTMLYYRWRRQRTPEVFRRNYKPGFLPRIPLALIDEFLNRLVTDRVVPAATVMQSMRADWKLGRSIPGLGTWQEYWHRLHGEAAPRVVAPAFPASASTFYAYLNTSSPMAYQRRIAAGLKAQRELNTFLQFIEATRSEIAARRNHEPLGATISR